MNCPHVSPGEVGLCSQCRETFARARAKAASEVETIGIDAGMAMGLATDRVRRLGHCTHPAERRVTLAGGWVWCDACGAVDASGGEGFVGPVLWLRAKELDGAMTSAGAPLSAVPFDSVMKNVIPTKSRT